MEQIVKELKEHLVRELNLEDINPEDIETDAPLSATDWAWTQSMRWR